MASESLVPTKSVEVHRKRDGIYKRLNDNGDGPLAWIFALAGVGTFLNVCLLPLWLLLGPVGIIGCAVTTVGLGITAVDVWYHDERDRWWFGIPQRRALQRQTKQLNAAEGWRPRVGAVHPRSWLRKGYRVDPAHLVEVEVIEGSHPLWQVAIVRYYLNGNKWACETIKNVDVPISEGESQLRSVYETAIEEARLLDDPPADMHAIEQEAIVEEARLLAAAYTQ